MKTNYLKIVKDIEARMPKELTKEYSIEYRKAIGWMLMNPITEEEAARYYDTPDHIEKNYQKIYENVGRYIVKHFLS
ncbi:MAG: hypothetical protein LUE20_00130 [Oscillospiraceae bacterium]|nr:hypothetical protein [Oscillospiraceae bacterium]